MPATDAMLGYGSKCEVSIDNQSSWVEIEEVFNIKPPSDSIDLVEATHQRSPNATKEFLLGLRDPGEASMDMNFIPGSASDMLLISIRDARQRVHVRITFPNGVTAVFTGLLMEYDRQTPNEDRMVASLKFKMSGVEIIGAEAAPINSIIPSISGIAQDGSTLTVFPGAWSGVPDFTYQWKLAGVDISGATGETYTPVAGDVGSAITVEVTGTNTTGNSVAESAATADVIAA